MPAEKKRISIATDIQSGSIIHADQRAIAKILSTLLDNAVKFTLDEGHVGVKTRTAHGALNIYVEDSGIGIAPSALAAIGRPFEQSGMTLSNGMKGSGLGLAIARSLIEMHGGKLRIRSVVGVGTVVMARIPANRHWSDPRATYGAFPISGTAKYAAEPIRFATGGFAQPLSLGASPLTVKAGEKALATLN